MAAQLYSGAVRAVSVAITRDPATVYGYIVRLRLAIAFFAVAYIVAMALVIRPGWPGGWPCSGMPRSTWPCRAHPGPHDRGRESHLLRGRTVRVEATLANLLIGGLVVMRMTFTTFALPRATTVPRLRRPRWWETS